MGDRAGKVGIWEASSGHCRHVLEGPGSAVEWLHWHPRGDLILAGSEDFTAWLWNAQTGAFMTVSTSPLPGPRKTCASSACLALVAARPGHWASFALDLWCCCLTTRSRQTPAGAGLQRALRGGALRPVCPGWQDGGDRRRRERRDAARVGPQDRDLLRHHPGRPLPHSRCAALCHTLCCSHAVVTQLPLRQQCFNDIVLEPHSATLQHKRDISKV